MAKYLFSAKIKNESNLYMVLGNKYSYLASFETLEAVQKWMHLNPVGASMYGEYYILYPYEEVEVKGIEKNMTSEEELKRLSDEWEKAFED